MADIMKQAISQTTNQNSPLAALRDLLLPMLMNGRVMVAGEVELLEK